MGEKVEFPSNGHTCSGYLAVPASGRGPGVVIIQEYWGLVPHIENVCDRYAAQGFCALAPDLYHGAKATQPDEAGRLMMSARLDVMARDLVGAVGYLLGSEHAGGDGVGAVGFCMGGGLALYLATIAPEVRAAVVYYGVIPWEQAKPELGNIRGRVLCHFGENDEYTSPEKVDDLEARLRDAGVDATFHRYPSADHAFFNDDRPEVYDEAAATQSLDRSLRFLRETLTSPAAARA